MIVPEIPARIEQSRQRAARRIDRDQVRAFEAIAKQARESQIVSLGYSAVLTADNVVHFMTECGVLFVNQAVFTTAGGPFRNLEAKFQANSHALLAKIRRARAFAIRRMCSNSRKCASSEASSGVS
jgi:hypothetical protein